MLAMDVLKHLCAGLDGLPLDGFDVGKFDTLSLVKFYARGTPTGRASGERSIAEDRSHGGRGVHPARGRFASESADQALGKRWSRRYV